MTVTGKPAPESAATTLKTRLRGDLRAAMKARAMPEAAVIRTLIAAIDNAEAPVSAAEAPSPQGSMVAGHSFTSGTAEVARLDLSAAQLRAILMAEAVQRDSLAQQMTDLGQPDRAAASAAEARIVRRYID